MLIASPVLAACSGSAEDDVRAAAQEFLDAWATGKTADAAAATTDAKAATALLDQTAADLPDAVLSSKVGAVTVKDDAATVAWTATWDLAAAPDWSYPASLRLRKGDQEWQVVAEPSVVHPKLGKGQHLELDRSLPERAAITDADGKPLFAPTEVVNVGVDTSKVTDLQALAHRLAAATGASAEKIVANVQAAPAGQFVPVITLRRPAFEAVRAQIYDLPGAVFPTTTRLLAPSPTFASALLGRVGEATAEVIEESQDDGSPRYAAGDQLGLSGLQRAFQEQLAGTPGFTVSVVRADGGTGEILAVSSNEAADPGNALKGRFPPGSSMKVMTSTALLSAGVLTPDTPVPCPATTTVEGRQFKNAHDLALGTVPLTEAFAQSCNTTFIQEALKLPAGALTDAAASYGVGTDWQLPVDLFSGSVPAVSTGTGKAADAIGQGRVEMSPAQLALVAAGVAGGKPVPPVEVVGADPAGATPTGPDQQVLGDTEVRAVVTSGTGAALADRGEVYGKTGTAEFGSKTPPDSHGWFMGYQLGGPAGDIAFAVLVEAGQSSSVAVGVTDAFLGALR